MHETPGLSRARTYDKGGFVAGAMIAGALGLRRHGRETSPAAWVGDVPRRKVRTPQGAMVGNAHRPGLRCAARIGTVPQKINRLGRDACATAAVRVKRRGKSSPAGRVTGLARQTPSGARPNKGAERVAGETRRSSRGVSSGPSSRIGPIRYDFRVGRSRRRATGVPEK